VSHDFVETVTQYAPLNSNLPVSPAYSRKYTKSCEPISTFFLLPSATFSQNITANDVHHAAPGHFPGSPSLERLKILLDH
jgi:hypothetical protein